MASEVPIALTAARIAAGWGGSLAVGAVLARHPAVSFTPFFAVGALAAVVLALVRAELPRHAVAITVLATGLQAGATWSGGGWPAWRWDVAATTLLRGLAAGGTVLVLGGAVFVAALFYAALAPVYRFGKFLVVGPLVGGAYWCATPLQLLGRPGSSAFDGLWANALLGILIGDVVAFAVELVESLPGFRARARGAAEAIRPAAGGDR